MLMFLLVTLGSIWSLFLAVASSLFGQKNKETKKPGKFTVGIFHPYCNAGGGGERVLWVALKCLQIKYPDSHFVVYTGDVGISPAEIISNAKARFNITLNPSIEFIYLSRRKWIEAEHYPFFTLLGQSIGSIYLGLEALSKFVPDIYIDTMGYAFTLPVFKYLGGSRICCYVHYPTISTDMLQRVSNRTESYNNRSFVARSSILSCVKLFYYQTFAKLYSWAGRSSEIIMVNSSWTESHITKLWKCPSSTFKVYPPCDVEDFISIPIKDDSEKPLIKLISVSQFRPEKDHPLQLKALHALRQSLEEEKWAQVRLVLIGSCRNEDDAARVQNLRDLCNELFIENNVEFKINISYEELKKELADGVIGLHTMLDEHFGISIVECMAAGLIMVANKSGGPMMDIVIEKTDSRNGFLAKEAEEYANVIQNILSMTPDELLVIKSNARKSVDRFSEKAFTDSFLSTVENLFQ